MKAIENVCLHELCMLRLRASILTFLEFMADGAIQFCNNIFN